MIIEIKDFPSDRKIKHITFDITFEEDGTPIVKTIPIPQVPVPFPVYGPVTTPVNPMDPPWTVTCDTTANVPLTSNAVREHKDIPPEMQNLEF